MLCILIIAFLYSSSSSYVHRNLNRLRASLRGWLALRDRQANLYTNFIYLFLFFLITFIHGAVEVYNVVQLFVCLLYQSLSVLVLNLSYCRDVTWDLKASNDGVVTNLSGRRFQRRIVRGKKEYK